MAPEVGFGGSFPVFDAIQKQFTWGIKQTLQLLARTFPVRFAGNSAGTLVPALSLDGYNHAQLDWRAAAYPMTGVHRGAESERMHRCRVPQVWAKLAIWMPFFPGDDERSLTSPTPALVGRRIDGVAIESDALLATGETGTELNLIS